MTEQALQDVLAAIQAVTPPPEYMVLLGQVTEVMRQGRAGEIDTPTFIERCGKLEAELEAVWPKAVRP